VALLEYFGETLNNPAGCGNCDICLDPPLMVDGTRGAQQMLLACIQTGQIFGQSHLIDIVRGANTEKIRSNGHHNLTAYGTGIDQDKITWRSMVRQLVAASFLRLDIAGHGGLSLTAKGHDLLNNNLTFNYRQDIIKPSRSTVSRSQLKTGSRRPEPYTLNPDQTALLKQLKDKRTELAQQRNVPAYIVFSDRSLEDMALRQPRDEYEFAGIHGVGAAKLRDFADVFLGIITAKPL
jgi:ATP-dependent DNA helicase RecQ